MVDNHIFSFSTKGADTRIIKEYLAQCKKNGQQQSKIMVDAMKLYINSTTKWIEQEHREIHMKKINEIYENSPNGYFPEVMHYLQLTECIHLNIDCFICREMYQTICNANRDERDECMAHVMLEYEKGVENLK